jgi:hypothetical protein
LWIEVWGKKSPFCPENKENSTKKKLCEQNRVLFNAKASYAQSFKGLKKLLKNGK